MGREEFGEHRDFNISQLPQALYLQDPDDILRFTMEMLNAERDQEEEILGGLLDLFDIDETPGRYIPYLADLIGYKPLAQDPDIVKREGTKNAISWYKAKGQPVAFDIILNAIGYPGRVIELWASDTTLLGPHGEVYHNGYILRRDGEFYHNGPEVPPGPGRLQECARWYDILPEDYTCDDIPAGWNPHSRIDLELDIDLETLSDRHPEGFSSVQAYLLKKIEEVRPIHVLLRQIAVAFGLIDEYPSEDITDELEGTVFGDLRDHWATTYFADCGFWHFDEPREGYNRDGGGYTWYDPVLAIVDALPPSPSTGDRYLHQGRIYEWDGFAWNNRIPDYGDALWVKNGPREDWYWMHFEEGDAGAWDSGSQWDEIEQMNLLVWDYEGIWVYGWKLCEGAPYGPGGPFFRDCPCAVEWDGPGPWDELEATVQMADSDDYERCYFHNGVILARDASYFHNCNHPSDEYMADEDQMYGVYHNGYIARRDGIWDHRRFSYIREKNLYHTATIHAEFEDSFPRPTDELEIIVHAVP